MRTILRDKVRSKFRTQDKCAYELGIDSGILSKIINETKDPSEKQIVLLMKGLRLKRWEVKAKE